MTTSGIRTPTLKYSEILRILGDLFHIILRRTRSGMLRIELLQEISGLVLRASGAERAEWWIREGGGYYRCEVTRNEKGETHWEADNLDITHPGEGIIVGTRDQQSLDHIYVEMLEGASSLPGVKATSRGSFYSEGGSGDAEDQLPEKEASQALDPARYGRSFILIPLQDDEENIGFMHLKSDHRNFFTEEQVEFNEIVAEAVAVAMVHQDAQAKLRERLKELGCLYDVVSLAHQPDLSLDEILQGVAELLPPAWQYPGKTAGRLVLDDRSFQTQGFAETDHMQSSTISIRGEKRGQIDVVYLEDLPARHEGPFLKEERNLIDALARKVSGIIERRQAQDERVRLENQLRHADRLATIGQLAAGVAHELNEPLGNILGFAQLAAEYKELPQTVSRDISKIVDACLYSRKVVSKLKLFARQMPAQRSLVDLNRMVEEELFFIEARCIKQGVKIVLELDSELPRITADPGQMHQILINLAVNAVQAMAEGGELTITTGVQGDFVALSVSDNGVGMTDDVMKQIFVPFYTTKDVEEGTGLGLSVVHGIIAAHGGSITVESKTGFGSTFAVLLPKEDQEPSVEASKQ